MNIDLIFLRGSQESFDWPLGKVFLCDGSVVAVCEVLERMLQQTDADALLFWDPSLGFPDPDIVGSITDLPGDVWHAGLKLGTAGLPRVIDCVHPTWMLNCDPDPGIVAVSWRVTLRACLVKTDVLRQLGGLRPGFETLLGAGLEWGHRLIKQGAMLRHVPELLPAGVDSQTESLPVHDELLFAKYRFPSFWYRWAVMRTLSNGMLPRREVLRNLPEISKYEDSPDYPPYQRSTINHHLSTVIDHRVTVLIPTIDRYPYLRTVLNQLRAQTIKPHEVIVVDQTEAAFRDHEIERMFSDLPLTYLWMDRPGQCTSRNRGLLVSTGNYILLLDDDVEIPGNYIERHLLNIQNFQADSSSGVVYEPGGFRLPESESYCRTGDVFPAGNTLVKRAALIKSGLFDEAYDLGQRADGDLGMRVMKSGAHMILDPAIAILHHRAPSGGLRSHGQRVVTRSSSRSKLTHHNLLGKYDFYLAKRYFTFSLVREMRWINLLSIFSIRGSIARRMMKILVGLLLLPFAFYRQSGSLQSADKMLEVYPRFPELH